MVSSMRSYVQMALAIYIFALRDIIGTALVFLSPETRDVAARVSGGK